MNIDIPSITRLEPLIRVAYELYCEYDPKPEPKGGEPMTFPLTEAAYVSAVKNEIESNYSFPKRKWDRLVKQGATHPRGPFTDEDCAKAVDLLNVFLSEALFIESYTGGGKKGVRLLKEKCPGFSDDFYKVVMGRMEYHNR